MNNLLEKPNLLLMSLKDKFYLMMGLVLSYFTSIYVFSSKVISLRLNNTYYYSGDEQAGLLKLFIKGLLKGLLKLFSSSI